MAKRTPKTKTGNSKRKPRTLAGHPDFKKLWTEVVQPRMDLLAEDIFYHGIKIKGIRLIVHHQLSAWLDKRGRIFMVDADQGSRELYRVDPQVLSLAQERYGGQPMITKVIIDSVRLAFMFKLKFSREETERIERHREVFDTGIIDLLASQIDPIAKGGYPKEE